MIVLSQNKDILVDCESVAVDENREGDGFVLIARTSNCETVVGHFDTEQDAKDAIHSLFLGTQLVQSVMVPCQNDRDAEALDHDRMAKQLKEIIFRDNEGLEDAKTEDEQPRKKTKNQEEKKVGNVD